MPPERARTSRVPVSAFGWCAAVGGAAPRRARAVGSRRAWRGGLIPTPARGRAWRELEPPRRPGPRAATGRPDPAKRARRRRCREGPRASGEERPHRADEFGVSG